MSKLTYIHKNGFILSLLFVVGAAFLYPELGAKGGALNTALLTKLGVMIIFFLQGLSLPTKELAHGLKAWRLHGFIQLWNFVFSAILLLSIGWFLNQIENKQLGQGFYYLALLPTTISSAVALTTTAGGNVSGAIFNTTLSNLLGVFWVPVMAVMLFAVSDTVNLPDGLLVSLLVKLSWLILAPLVVGQLVRPFIYDRPVFKIIKPRFKKVNNSIILFIVYVAFCNSVLSDTWNRVSSKDLFVLFFASLIAVLLIHALVWLTAKYWLSDEKDRITAFFCGSQKTLAAGVPMGVAIFSTSSFSGLVDFGLILIPLMCYHPMQLFLAGLAVGKLGIPEEVTR